MTRACAHAVWSSVRTAPQWQRLLTGRTAPALRAKVVRCYASNAVHIAAVSGSLRKASTNTGLLRYAQTVLPANATLEIVAIGDLPLYNDDLWTDQPDQLPVSVQTFRASIAKADALLIATPEYNNAITPALKNALDWGSKLPNVYADKTAAVLGSGGFLGTGRSQLIVRQIGIFLDLHFVNKPEIFIQRFTKPDKFDANGDLIDDFAQGSTKKLLQALVDLTVRLRAK